MDVASSEASTLEFVSSDSSRVSTPLTFGELSLYVRNHHVLDLELGNGMGRINVPSGQCAHIGFPFLL
jgi:hypothetical protein